VQTDPKEQKDNAQLSELFNGMQIADKAGGELANYHSSEQIAHQRWQLETASKQSSTKGNNECHGNIDQNRNFMHLIKHEEKQRSSMEPLSPTTAVYPSPITPSSSIG